MNDTIVVNPVKVKKSSIYWCSITGEKENCDFHNNLQEFHGLPNNWIQKFCCYICSSKGWQWKFQVVTCYSLLLHVPSIQEYIWPHSSFLSHYSHVSPKHKVDRLHQLTWHTLWFLQSLCRIPNTSLSWFHQIKCQCSFSFLLVTCPFHTLLVIALQQKNDSTLLFVVVHKIRRSHFFLCQMNL